MINVNQITSMLAKLPDQSLQKYAAMHKNDPYVMALAVAESNRRKEMRAAGQGQMGVQQQPKVVDQDIASMAAPMPENQGIAQLPAGDMDFADGGIVAFAKGGDLPSGAISRSSKPTDEELEKARRQTQMYIEGAQAAAAGRPTVVDRQVTPAKASWEQDLEDLQAMSNDSMPNWFNYSSDRAALEARQRATQEDAVRASQGQDVGSTFTPGGESGLRPQISAAPNQAPNQAPNPVANQQESGLGAAARAAGVGSMDVEGLTRRALEEAGKKPHPQANELEALGKERIAAAEENAKGIEAINKQFADIYKGREERLNKREGDISTMKDQNLGLALLQAGASMMTTPGGIGTAIGKGIDVGSKQYATGIERVRAAQEKLYDARDRLEELNAQRGELSAREQLKAKNEIKNAGIGAREDLIKANMDMYKVNRETALKMVDNQIRLGIAQMQEAGANARAARPGETLQIMKEYDRIAAEKGQAAADAYLERVGVVKGLGKADPGLKNPEYVSAIKTAERLQMLADSTTDPAKKAQRQADADAALTKARALLRPSNQSAAKVNSGGTSQSPVIDWSSIK